MTVAGDDRNNREEDHRRGSTGRRVPFDQAGGGVEHLLAVEHGRPAHAVSVVNLEYCRYYCVRLSVDEDSSS
jgi:hypothetical protein